MIAVGFDLKLGTNVSVIVILIGFVERTKDFFNRPVFHEEVWKKVRDGGVWCLRVRAVVHAFQSRPELGFEVKSAVGVLLP